MRLLLAVLSIDTCRNIIENLYFGLYFGGQYGLFPAAIVGVLGNPYYLIIPKIMNVVAACAVFGLLVLRWLPLASKERAEAEDEIRFTAAALDQESEERRRLFETSLDLILITDRQGVFTRVSPSSFATIGYTPEEMVGRSGTDFILPGDLEGTRREMQFARCGHHSRNFEARYIHKDGRIVPLAWSGVWSAPEERHFFFGRDMTERKLADDRLRRLALYDQLTEIPNRASLNEDLNDVLGGSQETAPVAIATFDIDGFKDINDTLGHTTGDSLLQQAAKRMVHNDVRVYRLGGDEFVMMIPGCGSPIIAVAAVEKILKRLAEPFEIDGHKLFVSASAGIAIAPTDGRNVDDLLGNADLALYDAKAAGGRCYRLFIPALRARANSRRNLDAELRQASANGEFVLYFQPQFRATDSALVGAEALIRWQHPEKGILAPASFIDALGESAAVLETGRWILRNACQTAASWRAQGLPHIKIGVNLFPAQFRYGTLLSDVDDALKMSGLPAEALELEITENIGLGNNEAVLAPLQALRAQGVGIAFDDFGTGYASLSYLTKYPLTRIKIDRSFVQKITEQSDSEDTAIVRSIITMARNLKLEVNPFRVVGQNTKPHRPLTDPWDL